MRLAGKAVGGYFATPSHLIHRIASLVSVDWAASDPWSTLAVIDPCAGEGTAAFGVIRMWSSDTQRAKSRVKVYAAELERSRACGLTERAKALPRHAVSVVHGDGLRIEATTKPGLPFGEAGASVLFLNPPYDHDAAYGRLEERFLRAWLPRLSWGGALVLIVPFESLAASADTIARHCAEPLACYRFPGDDFAPFKQVVLVARKISEGSHPDPSLRLRVLLWSQDAASIPELPLAPRPAITVRPARHGFEVWKPKPVDVEAMRDAFVPWSTTTRTGDVAPVLGILPEPSKALLRADWPVAMPPRPSHIAAALAAGVYSGAEVEPDDGTSGLPSALLKATFDRDWITREEKTNADGDVVGKVQVQRPQLRITALDLSTYAYHELEMSPEATGSRSLASFTAGDLLASYRGSLLGVLRERCPVLHDPQNPAHDFPLPALARPLYAAQANAARAAVKLLERGDGTQPLMLGEVGVGKSGSAIAVFVARDARSVLIMCPPHLLTSWQKQLRAVLGDLIPYDVFTLDDVHAVDAYAAWRRSPTSAGRIGVALLSREKAKLGHAWQSVTTATCPACGVPLDVEKSIGERARRRLVCEARDKTAANAVARITERLAIAMASRWIEHPDVGGNVPRRLRVVAERAAKARAARAKGEASEGRDAQPVSANLRASVLVSCVEVLADLASRGVGSEFEAALTAFVYRAVAAIGDETLALDVADHAATFTFPTDPHDYAGRNRIARVRDLGMGLCLYVRSHGLRGRRNALAASLSKGIPHNYGASAACRFDAWTSKDVELSGGAVVHAQFDHWYAIKRGDGGGVVYEERGGGKRWLFGHADGLPEALRSIGLFATWTASEPCGSPLYQAEAAPEGITEALRDLDALARGERPAPRVVATDEPQAVIAEARASRKKKVAAACAKRHEEKRAPVLRRVALASYISRRHAGLFDFMVADEAHELSSETSAQGRASTRLMAQIPEVLHLTGSSSNGYASSLFTMLWNASPEFRREFKRSEEERFVDLYGLRKRLAQQVDREGKVQAFGAHSDRVQFKYTDKGDSPGVLPLLVLKHLLPVAVTIQKADLKLELPPHEEVVVSVRADADLRKRHTALVEAVVKQVKKDSHTSLAGKLWGALARLPSQADRATEDTGNYDGDDPDIPAGSYVVAYPESAGWSAGRIVGVARPLPASELTAKERRLLEIVREELDAGRNVMVHPWHEEVGVRLARVLADHLGEPVARLDAGKVIPAKREDWIDREVIEKRRRVLVVNPVAVQTGLNNLVWFQTSVWFENPGCNPVVYDQASGRIDRIGKRAPSKSVFLVYDLPTQEALHRLLMHKAGVLRAIDGLSPEAALEAAGATEDLAFAGLGIGQELYALLNAS